MKRRLAIGCLALMVSAFSVPAHAIPAFARRYGVECHFCHEIFPRLNAMGERFKERGFRMERENTFDVRKWASSVPLTMHASGRRDFGQDRDAVNSGFFKPISAGNLGPRVSYWLDEGFLLRKQADFDARTSQYNVRTRLRHTEVDNGWARVEILRDGRFYIKGGRLELDLPFTQTRTPHLFSYEIYFRNPGFENDSFGDYQDGAEIGGDLPNDARWSLAVVKGRNLEGAERIDSRADRFDANVFARFAKRFGRHRVGAFAYRGRNVLTQAPLFSTQRAHSWEDHYFRVGVDGDAWWRRLNLYGVWLYGRSDNALASFTQPQGTREALHVTGGFLQADYHAHDAVALTLRLNFVDLPAGANDRARFTSRSLYPGVQWWPFPHLKLSAEYGFQNRESDAGAVQVEVCF